MIRKCNAEDLYKFNIKVMSFSQIAKGCAAEKAAEILSGKSYQDKGLPSDRIQGYIGAYQFKNS